MNQLELHFVHLPARGAGIDAIFNRARNSARMRLGTCFGQPQCQENLRVLRMTLR